MTTPQTAPGRAARPVAAFAAASFLSLLPPVFAAAPAAAPAAPAREGAEVVRMEAVVATGTRFAPRTATESLVPIDVLSNLDLNVGGYTEPAQML